VRSLPLWRYNFPIDAIDGRESFRLTPKTKKLARYTTFDRQFEIIDIGRQSYRLSELNAVSNNFTSVCKTRLAGVGTPTS